MTAFPKKQNKFHAKGSRDSAGRYFGSQLERAMWERLCVLQRAGEITDLQHQVTVQLIGEGSAGIRWKVDFSFCDVSKGGEICFIEAKGFETPDYVLKKKLWQWTRTERLEIWGGSATNLRLKELVPSRIG